jgi:flagellar hook-length control protein FliK
LRDRERSRAPDAAEHPGSPTQTSPSADEAGPRTGAGTAAPAGGEAGTSETATAQQGASTAQDAQTTAQGTAEQPTATTDGQIPQTPIGVGAGLETQTPATPQAAAPAEQEAPTRLVAPEPSTSAQPQPEPAARTAPETSVARAVAPQERPTRETRQPAVQRRGEPEPGSRAPAAARAGQVEQHVRVHQATGQAPAVELAPAATTPVTLTGLAESGATTTQSGHAGPAPQATDVETFANRVMRGLTAAVNQRGGVMTMRLTPPELGDLRVQMTIARGTVNVQFFAATPQAEAMLERSMGSLRAGLESHGLQVERISVHAQPGGSSNAAARDQAGDQNANQSRQHHDAGGGESRGRRDEPGQPGERRSRHFEPFDLENRP